MEEEIEFYGITKPAKAAILKGIRACLIDRENATKVELSQKLGLSFPTISKFLAEMEKDGEIVSAGIDESSGGRRAQRYAYNPENRLGLAIFLEGNETNYSIFNCFGEVRELGVAPSLLKGDISQLTGKIADLIARRPHIRAMAVGVPGSVDKGRLIHIPGYPDYNRFDLKTYLENRFALPTAVENDMNAAVLGFSKKHPSRSSLVYLYSGLNGPGAGMIINGSVVRGSTSFSGEVSYVPQYDRLNFHQALQSKMDGKRLKLDDDGKIDAISRLVAAYTAIINPHAVILNQEEVDDSIVSRIAARSAEYIPAEHLPQIEISNWEQDYLEGLKSIALDLVISEIAEKREETNIEPH
ncbi:ROK family protein [Gorillibacterium massiliense]|uniref:ROK family protein n=1 Tax=Gorillibacterium massiliense TaxID=1280390 RepID=UPI001EE2EA5D|nr:ROK family protein [Gorillibacterium massiliense]